MNGPIVNSCNKPIYSDAIQGRGDRCDLVRRSISPGGLVNNSETTSAPVRANVYSRSRAADFSMLLMLMELHNERSFGARHKPRQPRATERGSHHC